MCPAEKRVSQLWPPSLTSPPNGCRCGIEHQARLFCGSFVSVTGLYLERMMTTIRVGTTAIVGFRTRIRCAGRTSKLISCQPALAQYKALYLDALGEPVTSGRRSTSRGIEWKYSLNEGGVEVAACVLLTATPTCSDRKGQGIDVFLLVWDTRCALLHVVLTDTCASG